MLRYFRISFLTVALIFAAPGVSAATQHGLTCDEIIRLNLPIYAQETIYTCGVACFRSMLSHWGRGVPAENLLAYGLGTRQQGGTDSGSIIYGARFFHLYSLEQTGGIADLVRFLRMQETLYVGWVSNGVGHYSLVEGVSNNTISLMDPFYARENPNSYNTMTWQEFEPLWNDGVSRHGQILRIAPWELLP